MRRLALVFTAGAVWLFLLAIPVFADNGPHIMGANVNSLTGSCASCHRAHSGQAPDILKMSVDTLCESCHNGSVASTDVMDGRTTTGKGLRGGGFQFALIDVTNSQNASWNNGTGANDDGNQLIGVLATGQATNSHHSYDGSSVNMWGSGVLGTSTTAGSNTYTVQTNLDCVSCHDPHGNGQYRILRPLPTDATSGTAPVYLNDVPGSGPNNVYKYNVDTYGVGTDATQGSGFSYSDVNDGSFTPAKSLVSVTDGSSIAFVTHAAADGTTGTAFPNGYWQGSYVETSSRWCATCHTRYMGYNGSAGNATDKNTGLPLPWSYNGTGDATFMYIHATYNLVDPLNSGAPTTGILTPINTGAGPKTPDYIGCFTSNGLTFYGVAVQLGTGSAGPSDCAHNTDATSGAKLAKFGLTSHAPRCITCHVSHGSNATDSISGALSLVTGQTYDTLTGAKYSPLLRLDGRGVCQNCHKK